MEDKSNVEKLAEQGVFVFEDRHISDEATKYIESVLKDLKKGNN